MIPWNDSVMVAVRFWWYFWAVRVFWPCCGLCWMARMLSTAILATSCRLSHCLGECDQPPVGEAASCLAKPLYSVMFKLSYIYDVVSLE